MCNSKAVTSSKRMRTRTVSCYKYNEELNLDDCKTFLKTKLPASEEPCLSSTESSTSAFPNTATSVNDDNKSNTVSTKSVVMNTDNGNPSPAIRNNTRNDAVLSGPAIGAVAGVFLCLLIVGIALAIFFAKRRRLRKESLQLEPINLGVSAENQEVQFFPRERNETLLSIDEEQTDAATYAKITSAKLSDFPAHARKLLKNDDVKLLEEFKFLESAGKSQSFLIANERDNIHKNRYRNTVPCTCSVVENNSKLFTISFRRRTPSCFKRFRRNENPRN
eukprot:m.169896 g.169896  ORF g.169896 m.169896 type:complete len:277 (+) comp39019_c0_seq2:1073-1903(+)